jgi:hypothetical protein
MKQHLMEKIDAAAHRGDYEAADNTDHDRKQDEAGFSRSYERPQPARDLQGIPDLGD